MPHEDYVVVRSLVYLKVHINSFAYVISFESGMYSQSEESITWIFNISWGPSMVLHCWSSLVLVLQVPICSTCEKVVGGCVV